MYKRYIFKLRIETFMEIYVLWVIYSGIPFYTVMKVKFIAGEEEEL